MIHGSFCPCQLLLDQLLHLYNYDTFGYVGVPCQSDMLGFCRCTSVSLMCWSLWLCHHQSDKLCECMFNSLICECISISLICCALWVYVRHWYFGCMPKSLICWALWVYVCQSDKLGFVGVDLSVWYFGVVQPSVWYVGLCRCVAVSLICWALWMYFQLSDMWVYIHQSDRLGFVGVCPSVWWVYICYSDMLGFIIAGFGGY